MTPNRSELRQGRTFALDSARGVSDGVVQSFVQTVSLLIAVQVFDLADPLTALISAAPFIGNLLSLFYSAGFSRSTLTKSWLAAAPCFAASLAFVLAATIDGALGYALFISAGAVCFQLRLSFLTAIYHENYASGRRGTLYSRAVVLMTLSALVASWLCGRALDGDLAAYPWLIAAIAVSSTLSGGFIASIPTTPPAALGAANPFKNLALLGKDPVFGYILLTWFIFGFANLWLNPLRVVYVAESERGLGMSPLSALMILGVAWEGARLLSTPIWARLFDRINFVKLRIALNCFLGVGLVVFFATRDPWVIALGSFLTGVGAGGGGLAWNLWVTHYAPSGQTHIYMSIHSFLTGVRGVVGPYLAFWTLSRLSLREMSWVSAALIGLSVVMLALALPVLKRSRQAAL